MEMNAFFCSRCLCVRNAIRRNSDHSTWKKRLFGFVYIRIRILKIICSILCIPSHGPDRRLVTCLLLVSICQTVKIAATRRKHSYNSTQTCNLTYLEPFALGNNVTIPKNCHSCSWLRHCNRMSLWQLPNAKFANCHLPNGILRQCGADFCKKICICDGHVNWEG